MDVFVSSYSVVRVCGNFRNYLRKFYGLLKPREVGIDQYLREREISGIQLKLITS